MVAMATHLFHRSLIEVRHFQRGWKRSKVLVMRPIGGNKSCY